MNARLAAAIRPLALAVGVLALAAPEGAAQMGGRRTFLTITGLPLTVAGTTAAQFEAGSVTLGAFTFTVDLTANNPNFSPRATTVQIRCFAPCPTSGALSPTALQWRRGDLATWNTLTATFVTVEQRTATFNGANDPWSNTIALRYLLDWATAAPTTGEMRIQMQLTVTAP